MSLVSDVQDLLDDAGVFWVDAQVYDACNNAMLELWPVLGHDWYRDTVIWTSSQETADYAARMMVPKKLLGRGTWEEVASWNDLERTDRAWRNWDTGKTRYYISVDANTLLACPPSNETRFIRVEGIQYPQEEISVSNLDISDVEPVKEAVMYYAAALVAFNVRGELAELWFRLADEMVQEAKRRVEALRNATTSIKPATYHSPAGRHRGRFAFRHTAPYA